VAVKGMVKSVTKIENTFTVVMGDTADMSSVRCLIDSMHVEGVSGLQRGATVTIKGALTGFKKDETGLLGSDVELNRCVLQQE
jgi:tRNA_anti-like